MLPISNATLYSFSFLPCARKCIDIGKYFLEKVTIFATFFFTYGVQYPISLVCRIYQWLNRKEEILFTDEISQRLARFTNSRVRGQVNGIYVTTNESNLKTTLQFLQKQPLFKEENKTIHIGCMTWHNFDIMCARKSTYGLIVDFNPENALFIRKTIEVIGYSASREEFLENMIQYFSSLRGKKKALFFHPDQRGLLTERIRGELTRKGSWLQNEKNYRYIKEQLVAKGRLVAITEDITNWSTFYHIRKFLHNQNIKINTLYMSNIGSFMRSSDQKHAFAKSIKQLLNKRTIFIYCPKRRWGNTSKVTRLYQKAVLGKEILRNSFNSAELFEEII